MFKIVPSLVVTVAVTVAFMGLCPRALAESPDNWRATGAEVLAFKEARDDNRTVAVYASPAIKGSTTGILLRVCLSGFSDKRLALRENDDLPELSASYGMVETRGFKWKDPFRSLVKFFSKQVEKIVKRIEDRLAKYLEKAATQLVSWLFKEMGLTEASLASIVTDSMSGEDAVSFFNIRARAIVAAARSDGNISRKFVMANSLTVKNVASGSRGKAVRAIHSALLGAGAK